LRRESCSFSNGEFLKAGLGELESWCRGSTEEVTFHTYLSFYYLLNNLLFGNKKKKIVLADRYICVQYVGSAWKELRHIRQAVDFLVYISSHNLKKLSYYLKGKCFIVLPLRIAFLYGKQRSYAFDRLLFKSKEEH
jgi:DIL domain